MDISDLYVGVRDIDLQPKGTVKPEDLNLTASIAHLGVGNWTLKLPADHHMADYLRQPGSGIYVLERSSGSWETLFSGPVAQPTTKRTSSDITGEVTFAGYTDEIVIADATAWGDPANTIDAQTTPADMRSGLAETVMRAYVDANIGPSAQASRRGTLASKIILEADQGRGVAVRKTPRFQNLLELLGEIGLYSGLGFRLVQEGTDLVFKVYEPGDKRAFVQFSVDNGSLSEESVAITAPSVTRTIVAGQGHGIERTLLQRTTTESLAAETSWGRKIESWIDQRQTDDTSELEQAGDEPLVESGYTGVSVKAVPTDDTSMIYGRDWALGDIVRVIVNGTSSDSRINKMVMVANSGGLEIGAGLGDVSGFSSSTSLNNRVSNLESSVLKLEQYAEGVTPADVEEALKGLTVNIVEMSSSGNYEPPANLVFARVTIVGGGGGGGGAHATGSGQTSTGNGGGGAATVIAYLTPAQIGSIIAVTIGSGGSGGSVVASDGTDSTFGSLLTGGGGSGASSRGPTSSSYSRGGSAGTPGNGSATVPAQIIRGEWGQGGMGIGSAGWAQGGRGGNSAMGFGPLPAGTINTGSTSGTPLQVRGQGGSGAVNTANESARTGTDGTDGYCLIEEFLV